LVEPAWAEDVSVSPLQIAVDGEDVAEIRRKSRMQRVTGFSTKA